MLTMPQLSIISSGTTSCQQSLQNNEAYQEIGERIFKPTVLWAPEGENPYAYYARNDLGYFTYTTRDKSKLSAVDKIAFEEILASADPLQIPPLMEFLVERNVVWRRPVVYEDFLSKSAAGIFIGNQTGVDLKVGSDVVISGVNDPKINRFIDAGVKPLSAFNLYAAQEALAFREVMKELGIELPQKVADEIEKRIADRLKPMEFIASDEIQPGQATITTQPDIERDDKAARM